MGISLEYDIMFEYTFDCNFTKSVNIPRQAVPLLCTAFDIVIQERIGAAFYYPRYPENNTRCRYEWFISYNRDPYGIRISTYFDVGNRDIIELPFLASWGPRFLSKVGTGFSSILKRRLAKEIESVLYDVERVINVEPTEFRTFLFYIQMPPGNCVKERVTNTFITVYPSVQLKKEPKVISAVGIHIPTHFLNQAKYAGRPIADKFISLLSLISGHSIEEARSLWPKKFKFNNVHLGTSIELEKIYSMSSCIPAPIQYKDLAEYVKIASNLLTNQVVLSNRILWQAINAFVAGLETNKSQPTLSSVAFVASLAAFTKSQKCDGEVICSKCGNLTSAKSFRHDILSEKDCLIEYVKDGLSMDLTAEEMQKLKTLIRDVHSKQRSAFVHDAILRHAEQENGMQLLCHPGKRNYISDELRFHEDLLSIRDIARRILLVKLLVFEPKIQDILDQETDFKIHRQLQFWMLGTGRAKRSVGLRINRDEAK